MLLPHLGKGSAVALVAAGLVLLPDRASAQLFSQSGPVGTSFNTSAGPLGTNFAGFSAGFGTLGAGFGGVPVGNGFGNGFGLLPVGAGFRNGFGFGCGPLIVGNPTALSLQVIANNDFPLRSTQLEQLNQARFYNYRTVTGSGVLNGPVPIVSRFGGIGGMYFGPHCGCGWGNPGDLSPWGYGRQQSFGLLPAGVQLNASYNTLLGMQQPLPAIGRFAASPYVGPGIGAGFNPAFAGPGGCGPGKFNWGAGGYGL